ncbi:MAG: heparinase II/III family protein [Lentisphaerae bacterium]|nr:heparinase II/III family protein [Lentisphaerota bacterium]
MKKTSTFFPERLRAIVRRNAAKWDWAIALKEEIIRSAEPWKRMSTDAIWALMFGHTLPRSWMVWSNGHCPACRRDVPMYTWVMDALQQPWKTRCPHCRELFPKNDFQAFYRSGLDAAGVFAPEKADRALLFNQEHPDPRDPQRLFGVDDGQGYAEGEKRWRFIGAYLIYGQWRQAVLGGITRLAKAYLVSGNGEYARKAGILLDRVADLYPTFDYLTEGWTYERQERSSTGYVSVWHDACEETREMALAYDLVFEAIRDDRELVAFLADKTREHRLPRRKDSFAAIQANIEENLLRHPLNHREKIESNPPRTDIALLTMQATLDWPQEREAILSGIDRMIVAMLTTDGLTGEKGLYGYSAYAIQGLAQFFQTFEQVEPGFIKQLLSRQPQIHQTWRFHIDTWCLQSYYPSCGDAGYFAARQPRYVGVVFQRPSAGKLMPFPGNHPLTPSMFTFLWRLYEATGDIAFVQALHQANFNSCEHLPWDLTEADQESFQEQIAAIIRREGAIIPLKSVNKSQWHLAILRSGQGRHERALWLDYDSGNRHAHLDGLNIGLFAHGLDLMPDFGYPPVQFGGWGSPRSRWYMMTAAHNTLTVDGKNQRGTQWQPKADSIAARLTLWLIAPGVQAVRASGANLYENTAQYERTLLLVDISETDFYALEIFRVVGGTDHAKFIGSHFGSLATPGLKLKPGEDYGQETKSHSFFADAKAPPGWNAEHCRPEPQLRNFFTDANPPPGWQADWTIEDRYGYLAPGAERHFRYTDFSVSAQASICEAWVVTGSSYNTTSEAWVPRLMIRRRSETPPLASTFVGLIEAYETKPAVRRARCVALVSAQGRPLSENHVAIEIALDDGRADLIVARDVENPLHLPPELSADEELVVPDWQAAGDGSLIFLRREASGKLARAVIAEGRRLRYHDKQFDAGEKKMFWRLIPSPERPSAQGRNLRLSNADQ